MNVRDVVLKIRLIPYCEFPKPPLPNGRLPFSYSGYVAETAGTNPSQISPGKQSFYLGPPNGKICVAVRQTPDTMQMVRQQAERFRDEGEALLGFCPNGMK
jgi:hypothetical protein